MLKTKALKALGGDVAEAAKRVGVSYQAVSQWPDVLPKRIADRVLAALAREALDPAVLDDLMSIKKARRAKEAS